MQTASTAKKIPVWKGSKTSQKMHQIFLQSGKGALPSAVKQYKPKFEEMMGTPMHFELIDDVHGRHVLICVTKQNLTVAHDAWVVGGNPHAKSDGWPYEVYMFDSCPILNSLYKVRECIVVENDCTGLSQDEIDELKDRLVMEELRATHANDTDREHYHWMEPWVPADLIPNQMLGRFVQTPHGHRAHIDGINAEQYRSKKCVRLTMSPFTRARHDSTEHWLSLHSAIIGMNADDARARNMALFISTRAMMHSSHRQLMTVFSPYSLLLSISPDTLLWRDVVMKGFEKAEASETTGAPLTYELCWDMKKKRDCNFDVNESASLAALHHTEMLLKLKRLNLTTMLAPWIADFYEMLHYCNDEKIRKCDSTNDLTDKRRRDALLQTSSNFKEMDRLYVKSGCKRLKVA